MDKSALRRAIGERKQRLSPWQIEAASADLARQLLAHPLYQAASCLYAYLSYNQEVLTAPVIRSALKEGKRVAVPKIYGTEMRFVYLRENSPIAPGYKGIPEPVGDEIAREPDALMLMPGLAFTKEGLRMGYGGGFYDRFLAAEPHPTLALCYDFQLLPELPTQAHDIPVDAVLWAPILEVTL